MEIRWQIHFKSLLGTDYYIDIYDRTYIGSSVTNLTGAAQPITTNEDDDEDMYIPIRTQSGYIRFIVENESIIRQIQPEKNTDRPVVLRNGDNIEWMGFLRPDMYSQPWGPTPYEIEIPIMSVMEAMQGVEFTQDEGYTNLYSLIRTINGYLPIDIYITVPEETPIMDVYVNNNNFREFLTIPERTDRSTSNKYECISLFECVREFSMYFGISLHEYANSFFFVVYPDTGISYEDFDIYGNTQQSQWGSIPLLSMTICGSDNVQDYSKVYRRIKGEFDTNTDKVADIYSLNDDFFKHFAVEGSYPASAPTNMLFYGNSEVQPYKNGIQKTEWISDGSMTDSGGQIIRRRDIPWNTAAQEGSSWTDAFFVYSQKSEAGNAEPAIKFNIPKCIYLNNNEYAAFCVNFRVAAWFNVTQDGDFIKRIYCKIKVGNYWLKSDIPSGSTATRYTWTTTESICWILIDSGSITMKNTIYTIDYIAERTLDAVNGFAIDMPSELSAGYYPVYFELLANAEDTSDFGEYSAIGYLIGNVEISVMRGTHDVSAPTPDYDQNNIIRKLPGSYQDDYMIGCLITTRRGTQYGSGMALDSNHGYITQKYDEIGITRRASVFDKSREMIKVKVRRHTQPIDSVTYNNGNYGILSQSIDWRNDQIVLRIINID